jgi:hypothetical protein
MADNVVKIPRPPKKKLRSGEYRRSLVVAALVGFGTIMVLWAIESWFRR